MRLHVPQTKETAMGPFTKDIETMYDLSVH